MVPENLQDAQDDCKCQAGYEVAGEGHSGLVHEWALDVPPFLVYTSVGPSVWHQDCKWHREEIQLSLLYDRVFQSCKPEIISMRGRLYAKDVTIHAVGIRVYVHSLMIRGMRSSERGIFLIRGQSW